jgi:hypothetical protein
LNTLNGLKNSYGDNIIDETIRTKLEEALAKHMLYPFEKIKTHNKQQRLYFHGTHHLQLMALMDFDMAI